MSNHYTFWAPSLTFSWAMAYRVFFLLTTFVVFILPVSASALTIDHADYAPGQPISVTCGVANRFFQVYSLTTDTNIGYYDCGTPATVNYESQDGHSYSILEGYGSSCDGMDYSTCASQGFIKAEIQIYVFVGGGTGGSVTSGYLRTDKTEYLPTDTVELTCSYSHHTYQLYDTTDDINLGLDDCGTPAMVSRPWVDGHSYSVLEIYGSSCDGMGYATCASQGFIQAEATFTVSVDAGSGGGGGGGTPSPGTSKSSYTVAEPVLLTCVYALHTYQLYDLTDGTNLGLFNCGSPATVSFEKTAGHAYAILEIYGSSCDGMDYATCAGQGFVQASYFFWLTDAASVDPAGQGGGFRPPQPTVHIVSPKTGTIFSKTGTVDFSTTNTARTMMYYSDKIADWNRSLVNTNDAMLISTSSPANGPYTFDTSMLTPGVAYRLILVAMNLNGSDFTQTVSDVFTVDFDAPQFVVKTDPAVTRGGDVTIIVDSSKDLVGTPTTTVTQSGGSSINVAMKAVGPTASSTSATHFVGTYHVVDGHDGVAKIAVSGVDVAGNVGTDIVSGGTLAVGVNPPPTPKVTTPLNNIVTSSSTITVSGTMRADSSIVVTVNGVDVYKAPATTSLPGQGGKFIIPNIKLDSKVSRGVNIVSIAAKDITGLLSAPVTLSIKYNIPPTIALEVPKADAVIGGQASLSVKASDRNADPLQYTYQIIREADYDPALDAATTSKNKSPKKNNWITIADQVPTSGFAWDTTEVDDGSYLLRVITTDGIAEAQTEPSKFYVKNTLPLFKFLDGRKTVVGLNSGKVVVSGHALTPRGVDAQIVKIEYSTSSGRTWINAPILTGASTTDATFSVSFSNLAEGEYGVLWRVKDTRKLYGKAAHPIVVDGTPPAAPVVLYPAERAVIGDTDDENATKKGVQIHVAGRTEPFSTVTLTYEGATGSTGSPQARTAKASLDGSFVFRDVDVSTRGGNTVSVSAQDTSGNTGVGSSVHFVYDNPPVVTILSPKPDRALSGKSTISWSIRDADGDSTQSITLSYRKGNGAFTDLPVDISKNSFVWDVSDLPQSGTYELRLSAGDGVAVSSETVHFSIDRTPPVLSSLVLTNSVLGRSDTLKAKGEATDGESGIEYVEYAIEPLPLSGGEKQWVTALVTKGFLRKNASFAISHPVRLEDGNYRVFARAVDAAGNTSEEISEDIAVDGTPPRIGSFNITQDGIQIMSDREGTVSLYKNATDVFGISLESDTASSSLTINGVEIPLTMNVASGLWEATLPVAATGEKSVIRLSAEDRRHNKVVSKEIGALAFVDRGWVHDTGSRPVPGARIRIKVLNAETNTYSTFTVPSAAQKLSVDENGTYGLILPQGEYSISAIAEGYNSDTHTLVLDRTGIVNLSFTIEKRTGVWGSIQNFIDRINQDL